MKDDPRAHEDEMPFVWMELWLVFSAGAATFLALLVLLLTGIVETPVLLVGALPLSIISLTRSTRAFHSPARWINARLDQRRK